MPGFITHLTFGEQTLSFIDSKETISILDTHSTCFGLGLQGPDIFFYHIPSYLLYKLNIGNIMHRQNVMLFFDNLINARNFMDNEKDRAVCDAYIIGFIGHYSLDVACHPYIYYKSDHFNNLKRGHAYDFGKHVSLETDIDHILLDHYFHIRPNQFDYAAAVRPTKDQKIIIANLLHSAINNTFPNNKVRLCTIKGAINSFIKLNKMMHDPKGKKKKCIRNIEQFIFKCCVISAMIPSDTIIKYVDPCNTLHNTWHNPWNPIIPRTESVIDLINKTMPQYLDRIKLYMLSCGNLDNINDELDSIIETDRYLHYRNQLLANLSDLSYISGLPIKN
ncbi:zinc dependent phospholipase C family protein [Pseudobutyrivibrio xylanivorans]|nr:zinc dependent phospholipase C family protein [Pseudobutyrivibrio xylanivorans]